MKLEMEIQEMTAVAYRRQEPFSINSFILRHVKSMELIGVIMRIISFSLVSWLGSKSPFLFVWAFNLIDAVLLSWCAVLKKDFAYTLLNGFWILVGLIGILRTLNLL